MTKATNTVYVCQSCGFQSRKWLGKCPDCGEWNSLVEERARASVKESNAKRVASLSRTTQPIAYGEIESQEDSRTPSGITEFDRVLGGGIVPGSLVLIGGEPGIGKCLVGSTRVLDPESGALLPITEWETNRRSVLSLDTQNDKLRPQSVAAFHAQGVRPIIELKTRLGRKLRCTANHPLLTPEGWRSAGELAAGARIAAPRALPFFGDEQMPLHELKLAAYILSDGAAQSQTSVTNTLPEVARDMQEIAQAFGVILRVYVKKNSQAKQYRFVQPHDIRRAARSEVAAGIKSLQSEARVSWAEWSRRAGVSYSMLKMWRRGNCVPSRAELQSLAASINSTDVETLEAAREQSEMRNAVAGFTERLGLRFHKAGTKAVPEAVFRLSCAQLSLFLQILFSCDGSVYVTRRGVPGVSYSTISRRLAEDVQHLLLRFGFISRLREKNSDARDRSYEIQLLGVSEVKRFLREIGIYGREEARAQISAMNEPRKPSTHFDTVPTGTAFWENLRAATRGDTFREVSAKSGVFVRDRRHAAPLCRSTVNALAKAYPSKFFSDLAASDIYWDEIVESRAAGEEAVYDITVPHTANFVANDLIVHNSTLLLQIADRMSAGGNKVLYVSGEESERQIKLRGERLNIEAENLFLMPETTLEAILDEVERMKPDAVIVDSVQTVFSEKIESAPGSVSQVREVANQFLMLAKQRNVAVFLIGHVTKEGAIAGPKALEHIVDTVLYFEGERHHNHRIVRAVKNRFGAANELGVFEMTGAGLVAVANPSELFLQERPENVAGSVVVACMEGTRPLLVEMQALVSSSKYGTGRRMAQGFDTNRVALLIAMLEKRVGLQLLSDDVFINVAGGLEIDEPAADLGVVAAIASSFRNLAVDPRTVVFGEVGLTGEVRGGAQANVRAREAQAMGFEKIILPLSNKSGLERLLGVRVVGVRSVEEALEELFA